MRPLGSAITCLARSSATSVTRSARAAKTALLTRWMATRARAGSRFELLTGCVKVTRFVLTSYWVLPALAVQAVAPPRSRLLRQPSTPGSAAVTGSRMRSTMALASKAPM